MRSRILIMAGFLGSTLLTPVWSDPSIAPPSELTQGIQAYQEERWTTALSHFLHVIEADPSNNQAHTYVKLIVQKLETRQASQSHEDRMAILTASSKLLGDNGQDTRIVDHALHQTTESEADRQQADGHAQCTMAQMEAQLGHLAAANDLVLQVIAKNPNDQEAQRLLSDLQSQIRQTLDTRKDLSLSERHALEGFYAFGQADYATAAAAWGQARNALEQSSPGSEAEHQVSLLHFERYDQIARTHLEEERQVAQIKSLFAEGLAAFEKQDFNKSLDDFRQIALVNPEYSQLGFYLAKSLAAVDRQRTQGLSDEKRQKAAEAFSRGVANLEKGKYAEARNSFQDVLDSDPDYPQARLYMAQIDTQQNRQTDRPAAQQHYEAGLIAYASGDSEQAIREWHIAQRLDPDNPKIADAVNKVQRELVLSKELP